MLRTCVVWIGLLLLIAPTRVHADDPFGYSGLTQMDDSVFLAVRDLKHGREHEPRLVVVRVRTEAEIGAERRRTGMRVQAVETQPLRLRGLPIDPATKARIAIPNDLEACCAIPGRPDEYLLSESGFHQGRYGRIFHVRIARREGAWHADYVSHFRPFDMSAQGSTPKHAQIEGMLMLPIPQRAPVLVLGQRGSAGGGAWTPAQILWGALRMKSGKATAFAEAGRAKLKHTPHIVRSRGCADLHLRPRGDGWTVWTVGTHDFGDVGPFRSVVYEAGRFAVDPASGTLTFTTPTVTSGLWQIRGLKVEGLAGAAAAVPGSVGSMATECEAYGGVWRPLALVAPREEGCLQVPEAREPKAADVLAGVRDRLAQDATSPFIGAEVEVVQFQIFADETDPDHCVFHFLRGAEGAWSDGRQGLHPGIRSGELERSAVMLFTLGKGALRRLWAIPAIEAFETAARELRAKGAIGTFGSFAPDDPSGIPELWKLIRR